MPAKKNDIKDQYRVNERIRAKEVRLVGDNVEQGVYTIQEAMHMADEQGLDLIEISPNAVPPVCKILDYQKFLYQQKKRQKEQKAKSTKIVVKEIRFGPQTDDHDYNFKLKHAIGFLNEGAKVKAYVFFKGRSILFKEQGEVLLLRFANDLEDYGKVEMMPVLEGKRMIIMITIHSIIKLKFSKMPKIKTNSGAKKRFALTGTGKIKRKHAYKSHILTKKTKKQKRNLTHMTTLKTVDVNNVKALLGLK